jgi:hypothetical protein
MSKKANRRTSEIDAIADSRPAVIFRPPACPSCGCTQREPFRDGPVMSETIAIEIAGRTYNREIWHNATCSHCGQRYRIIEYRFEPGRSAIAPGCFGQSTEDARIAEKAVEGSPISQEMDRFKGTDHDRVAD